MINSNMAAEATGKRLLGEVEEVGLDRVSFSRFPILRLDSHPPAAESVVTVFSVLIIA